MHNRVRLRAILAGLLLGLTICAQIVKAHGGVLRAGNRTDGGAVFTFILPLPKRENGAAPAGEPESTD